MLERNIQSEPCARYAGVGLSYGPKIVFEALDLTLNSGEVTVFCGPNGCGKSTALKALRRLMRVDHGDILLDDAPIGHLSNKEMARRMAMLTQSPTAPDELLVEQLVGMGRYAHQRQFSGPSEADRQVVGFALSACGMACFADRPLGSLSGGQLQRAWLATIIAQDAPVILLDEPTNHLDLKYQIDTLELVRSLNRSEGKTIILVLHDLNLAARYADTMVMFSEGRVHAQGTPDEVMQEPIIRQVFGIDCQIVCDPRHGKPLCIPYSS